MKRNGYIRLLQLSILTLRVDNVGVLMDAFSFLFLFFIMDAFSFIGWDQSTTPNKRCRFEELLRPKAQSNVNLGLYCGVSHT